MEITLNNDYCLQFNETYFVSRRNSKKDVRDTVIYLSAILKSDIWDVSFLKEC